MAKDTSTVAPKERINVRFIPATGNEGEEIELPMKTVIVGDFTGREDGSPLEEREAVSVNKNNFEQVLKEMGIEKEMVVKNALQDEDEEAVMQIKLKLESMDDFRPDNIARQVPEVKSLMELRDALTALKGPLGNMPDFRRALNDLIADEDKQKAITAELSQASEDDAGDKASEESE